MINNESVINSLIEQWTVIESLSDKLRPFVGIVGGKIFNGPAPPDESFNLLLVLSYSCLDEFLSQCLIEDIFSVNVKGKFPMLGAKMVASKQSIKWKNYKLINEGKIARNNLAHKSKFADKKECEKYIDAVKNEFLGWGILS